MEDKAEDKTKTAPKTKKAKGDSEQELFEKVAAMPDQYRELAEKLHVLIKRSAPELACRVWYGMPAYAKDGKVICFFRGDKAERYMTLGFNEADCLDRGGMWPTSFALLQLTEKEEGQIADLIRQACGPSVT